MLPFDRNAKESNLRLTHLPTRLLLAASMVALAACSGRQIYQSATGWRQNECQKVLESGERARCLETANKDYDGYRREKGEQ